ncbi:MAG: hypothetical protein NTX79_06590 [Candidatus Micrarchaeota archaeon]|nr:hypothetical protein [Candidatus Micrarchaeota archaeon]
MSTIHHMLNSSRHMKEYGKTVSLNSQNTQKAAGFAGYLVRNKIGLMIAGGALFQAKPGNENDDLKKIKDIISPLCIQMEKQKQPHNILFIFPNELEEGHHHFIKNSYAFELYTYRGEGGIGIDVGALSLALRDKNSDGSYPDAIGNDGFVKYESGVVSRLATFIGQHSSFLVAGLLKEARRTIGDFQRLFNTPGMGNRKVGLAYNFVMNMETGLLVSR